MSGGHSHTSMTRRSSDPFGCFACLMWFAPATAAVVAVVLVLEHYGVLK